MMCGGTGDVQEANDEVRGLCEMMKEFLEKETKRTFPMFKAIQFSSQVVSGTNYFVKVQVGDEEYYHLRIFKPLPHVNGIPQLAAYQEAKTLDDKLGYFDKK